MNVHSPLNPIPAHPRLISPAADHYRTQFKRPPNLDERGLSHGHILAAFKGAARYMGLRGNILVAMDYFFGLTRPQDWTADATPIVWPSAREQCEAMGLSLSRVKFLNRKLIDLGLIIAKDSPTGARWGRRNHNGQIVEAYGFDLSPMAHRVAEFTAIRDEGRADDAVRSQLRRRKTVAIKSIGQIVRTAIEAGIDTPDLHAMANGYLSIVGGLDPTADRLTLERIVTALESLRDDVHAIYCGLVEEKTPQKINHSAIEKEKKDPTGSDNEPPNNNYKPTSNLKTSRGFERSSSGGDEGRGGLAPEAPKNGDEVRLPTVRPQEVIELAPGIGLYLNEDLDSCDVQRAVWAVIRAAETYSARELGISKPLWADAQKTMGAWPTALAVMVVAAKDPNYFSRTPGHYFAGMVEKAKQGTLRLDRSIWGLRTKTEYQGARS